MEDTLVRDTPGRLDEVNRTIPGRPGFDNSERGYSSAVGWPRGRLGCTQQKQNKQYLEQISH